MKKWNKVEFTVTAQFYRNRIILHVKLIETRLLETILHEDTCCIGQDIPYIQF